jgi:REP element-mobilizing transposase RayT
MAICRRNLISLSDTPYYHCVSRCVRRCFLCGIDDYSGKSYEHRRSWVEQRLLFLASVFAIDICAYAVMSNHVHVVLHIDKPTAEKWSIKTVLCLWHKIHKGTLLTQKYLAEDKLTAAEIHSVTDTAEVYRRRLYDISWFMRDLNEYIARAANKEDECTGRFWEGRFKSQALLGESALLSCMAYVDLNPVRAKIAKTPESSPHTSIYVRTQALKKHQRQPSNLMPFIGNHNDNTSKGVACSLIDYCLLVDTTGRAIRDNQKGYISNLHQPILERLGISKHHWLALTTKFEKYFSYAVGPATAIQQFIGRTSRKHYCKIANAKTLFQQI